MFASMKPRHVYLILCVLGLVLPYSQLVPWLLEHGLNATLFFRELLTSRIGAFFAMDVIVSAIVLLCFIQSEGKRLRVPASLAANHWNIDCWRIVRLPAFSFPKTADAGSNKRCSVIGWGIYDVE